MLTPGTAGQGWLILSVGLAGVIAYQWQGELSLTRLVTAIEIEEPDLNALDPPEFVPPSEDIVAPILERPLFAASRRPVTAEETERPEAVQDQGTLLQLRLIGTMQAGRTRAALVQRGDAGLVRLRIGADLCGWRIDWIDDTGITLSHDGRSIRLELPLPAERPAKGRAKTVRCALDGDPATVPAKS